MTAFLLPDSSHISHLNNMDEYIKREEVKVGKGLKMARCTLK